MSDIAQITSDNEYVDVKYEVINGDIYLMASPTAKHGRISKSILDMISSYLKDCPCEVWDGTLDLATNRDKKTGEYIDKGKKNECYVIPDIMITCEEDKIEGGRYYGVPKFIVEIISPGTSYRDKAKKFKIYESLGVDEYWIVTPSGVVEVYYLENGEYVLHDSLVYSDEKIFRDGDRDVWEEELRLRSFPNISMRFCDIFKKVLTHG